MQSFEIQRSSNSQPIPRSSCFETLPERFISARRRIVDLLEVRATPRRAEDWWRILHFFFGGRRFRSRSKVSGSRDSAAAGSGLHPAAWARLDHSMAKLASIPGSARKRSAIQHEAGAQTGSSVRWAICKPPAPQTIGISGRVGIVFTDGSDMDLIRRQLL
jgi:hypothetical protein